MQTLKPLTKTCRPQTPAVHQCCTFCRRSIIPHPSSPLRPPRILAAPTHRSSTPPRPPNYLHKTRALVRVRRPVRRSRWITTRRLWTRSRSTTESFWTFRDIALETPPTAANKACADASRTALTLDTRHFSP